MSPDLFPTPFPTPFIDSVAILVRADRIAIRTKTLDGSRIAVFPVCRSKIRQIGRVADIYGSF